MKKNSLKKWGVLTFVLMTGFCFPVVASASPGHCGGGYGNTQCIHGNTYASCDTCAENDYCIHGGVRGECGSCYDGYGNGYHRGGGHGHGGRHHS